MIANFHHFSRSDRLLWGNQFVADLGSQFPIADFCRRRTTIGTNASAYQSGAEASALQTLREIRVSQCHAERLDCGGLPPLSSRTANHH